MPATGLRERKKERTRATITRVALELFARDGFSATTVTAIAEAADVSPRTVSTYFPSKEGIVFSAYQPSFDRLAGRLAGRQPGETVMETLRAWLIGEEHAQQDPATALVQARNGNDVDFARLREAAIESDPELWAMRRRQLRSLEGMLARAVAHELGVAPDSLPARVAGASTAAALLELNGFAARGGGSAAESLEVVLGYLRAGTATLTK